MNIPVIIRESPDAVSMSLKSSWGFVNLNVELG